MSQRKNKAFISYSHKDKEWLNRLCVSLKASLGDSEIIAWDDRSIEKGRRWDEEIREAIADSCLAILLVTDDFLASDYITQSELPLIMAAAKEGKLTVLWVAVRPSSVKLRSDISQLEAANDPARPLSVLPSADVDSVMVQICDSIHEILKKYQTHQVAIVPEANEARSPGAQRVEGHNFPCPVPFRDREKEMAALREQLSNPAIRLACVIGRMGAGKTALVSRFCELVETGQLNLGDKGKNWSINGIVYFTFRSSDKQVPEQLFQDVGRLLNESDRIAVAHCFADRTRDEADKFGFLLSRLPGNYFLLALDNFELALDSDNRISDPSLATFFEVCLTTRHPLRVVAATRDWVSVNVSAARAVGTIPLHAGLPIEEGVAMLEDLFQSQDPIGTLGLRDSPREQLTEAVQRCSGLPSALQLITGILAASELTLAELLENHDLFDTQIVDRLVHQQLELLAEDRRRVLEAMSVYNCPVNAAAIAHLLEPFVPAVEVNKCLRALAQSFLVRVSRVTKTYELEPSIREGAYKLIPESGAEFSKLRCHARAAEYYRVLRIPKDQWRSIEDLRCNMEEFKHLCLGNQFEAAAALIDEIDENYLLIWGHSRALAAMRTQLVGKLTDPAWQCRNLGRLGHAWRLMGRRKESLEVGRQAVELAKHGDKQPQLVEWLGHLADASADAGKFKDAVACYQEAIAVAKSIGDVKSEAWNLGGLAIQYRQSGQVDEAIACYDRGIDVAQKHNDLKAEARFTCNRAWAYLAQGDWMRSLKDSNVALDLARRLGYKQTEAFAYHHMGRAHIQARDFEQVVQCNLNALRICENTTYEQRCEALIHRDLGYAYHHLGKLEEAMVHYLRSSKLRETETEYGCAAKLALVYLQLGDKDSADQNFLNSIELCQRLLATKEDYYEGIYQLAFAHLGISHTEQAITTFQRGLRVSSHQGTVREALIELELMARSAPTTPGLLNVRELLELALKTPERSANAS